MVSLRFLCLVSIRNLFLLLRHLPFPQMSPSERVVGMPSALVPCGRHGRKQVLAKCGKGSLLRRVEPCEQAIGRMHGRRLLLRWLAKRAVGRRRFCGGVQLNALTTPLQYIPKSRFVSTVRRGVVLVIAVPVVRRGRLAYPLLQVPREDRLPGRFRFPLAVPIRAHAAGLHRRPPQPRPRRRQ